MEDVGKWIIYAGIGIVIIGLIVWIGSKLRVPFGNFPGDISIKTKKIAFYFPVTTSLAISIILTVILNLILWLTRK